MSYNKQSVNNLNLWFWFILKFWCSLKLMKFIRIYKKFLYTLCLVFILPIKKILWIFFLWSSVTYTEIAKVENRDASWPSLNFFCDNNFQNHCMIIKAGTLIQTISQTNRLYLDLISSYMHVLKYTVIQNFSSCIDFWPQSEYQTSIIQKQLP